MVVAGNDPGEMFAQDFFQHPGASAGRNKEEDGPESNKGPEVASFAFVFPAGLVKVEILTPKMEAIISVIPLRVTRCAASR